MWRYSYKYFSEPLQHHGPLFSCTESSAQQSAGELQPAESWHSETTNEKERCEESSSAESEQSGDESDNDDDWDDESERFKSTSDSEEFSTSIIPGHQNTSSLWRCGAILPPSVSNPVPLCAF